MTLDQRSKEAMGEESWSPGFVDYLFLAFNTSTAFSPTDSPVLSVGQVIDDGPGAHLVRNGGTAGGACSQHHLTGSSR
jgi:hypothetical protein